MITFDNQISTGIQAFGHCGSPTCSMTSAFGANPDSTESAQPYDAEQEDRRVKSFVFAVVVISVISSFLIAKKASDE
jgi:hypothetical protein